VGKGDGLWLGKRRRIKVEKWEGLEVGGKGVGLEVGKGLRLGKRGSYRLGRINGIGLEVRKRRRIKGGKGCGGKGRVKHGKGRRVRGWENGEGIRAGIGLEVGKGIGLEGESRRVNG
jgi:hypothetical protein